MLGLTLESLTQGAVHRDHGHEGEARLLSPATARSPESGDQMASLVRTIESEIIPRLMLAHRDFPELADASARARRNVGEFEVARFARIVLTDDVTVSQAYVDALRTEGVPVETLCLDLLAPTARALGDLWEADLCDFVEVTVGLGRLQQVLRELSPAFRNRSQEPRVSAERRIVLAPAPGDQHSLGLLMVREFFHRAGWDVRGGLSQAAEALPALVRSEWFDAAGFSVGSECRLDGLSACIRSTRNASRNRAIGILVGGPIFAEHPELVAQVGADATAFDARQAVVEAENLLKVKQA